MKYKKTIMLAIFLAALLAIGGVCASDVNGTDEAGINIQLQMK